MPYHPESDEQLAGQPEILTNEEAFMSNEIIDYWQFTAKEVTTDGEIQMPKATHDMFRGVVTCPNM
jgi:hypothetical protein